MARRESALNANVKPAYFSRCYDGLDSQIETRRRMTIQKRRHRCEIDMYKRQFIFRDKDRRAESRKHYYSVNVRTLRRLYVVNYQVLLSWQFLTMIRFSPLIKLIFLTLLCYILLLLYNNYKLDRLLFFKKSPRK